MSRERWAEAFAAVALEHWTPERTRAVTAGKKLPFLPGPAAVLLRALGLLHTDASMPPKEVRKYRQINHMLAVLRPSLRELARSHPTVRVVDAGCGRSYLTLLVAWWFTHVARHPVEVLGIDRREALLTESRRRAGLVGLDGTLRFAVADLDGLDLPRAWAAAFGAPATPHAVLALHACDTATDAALALGMRHAVSFLAVAPCCQAELAAKWAAADPQRARGLGLGAVWTIPTLRREAGAVLTDAMRTQLLRAAGYDATAVEFVGAEHTPKNTLLRGMLRGPPSPEAWAEYLTLREAAGGIGIALEEVLAAHLDDPSRR